MSDVFACPRCRSTDWIRVENVEIDSTGKFVQTNDVAMKCGNCQQRIDINDEGAITPVDSPSPTSTPVNRVRSSVTADARGIGRVGQGFTPRRNEP